MVVCSLRLVSVRAATNWFNDELSVLLAADRRRREVDPLVDEDVDVIAGAGVPELAEPAPGAIGSAESRNSSDICVWRHFASRRKRRVFTLVVIFCCWGETHKRWIA